MAVFAILGVAENTALDAAVQTTFPNACFKMAPAQWLVAAKEMTTKEIVERLGAVDERFGFIVCFAVSNWWGWHRKDMWEWLNAKGS